MKVLTTKEEKIELLAHFLEDEIGWLTDDTTTTRFGYYRQLATEIINEEYIGEVDDHLTWQGNDETKA